jgi:hypothetical protein
MPEKGGRVTSQAVLLIHGMGDQQPMDTLRSFVEAVLDDPQGRRYWSKPDMFSGSFDLRRLSATVNNIRTDFYELYWQHRIQGSRWHHLWGWGLVLLRRPFKDVPSALRLLWVLAWLGITLTIAAVLLVVLLYARPDLAPSWLPSNAPALLPITILIILGVGHLVLQYFALRYLADAARYLSASPENIDCRNAIRQAGVLLIERLHDSKKYGRIIVVGHSLGSVIGYDILTYAWERCHRSHLKPHVPCQDALHDLDRRLAQAPETGHGLPLRRIPAHDYRELQRHVWAEQRANGCPWLVTDFVTIGSPLAHASLLMARSAREFCRKVSQREFPVCPPVLERDRVSFEESYVTDTGERRTIRVLHHAACFGPTRWTNLFFRTTGLLRGDFIAGPLAPLFGRGIEDIELATPKNRRWLAHTSYWSGHSKRGEDQSDPLTRLREALDLDCRTFYAPAAAAHVARREAGSHEFAQS